MRILCLTNLFPHPADPQHGIFFARRFAAFQREGAKLVILYSTVWVPRIMGVMQRWRDREISRAPLPDYDLNVVRVPTFRITRGTSFCRWDGLLFYLAIRKRMARLHSAKPFDIIYGAGLFPGADTAGRLSRLLGIPAVGVGIGSDVNLVPNYSRSMHRHVVRVLQALDGLLANGEGVAEQIRQVTGRECRLADGVVDLDLFCPCDEKERERQDLGLPLKRTIVLFAGYLKREKGLYELMEAFELAREDYANLMLVVCGRGTEGERLRRIVEEKGMQQDVLLAGQVEPGMMHKWMRGSDMFVLPSYHEGMPNSVMEAMACGLPVISTAVGGLPAAVGTSKGAILVPPRAVVPLSKEIARLCGNETLRKEMSLAARETATAKFGLRTNVLIILDFLRDVINARKAKTR